MQQRTPAPGYKLQYNPDNPKKNSDRVYSKFSLYY